MQPKKFHRSIQSAKPRVNTLLTNNAEKVDSFNVQLATSLRNVNNSTPSKELWKHIKTATYTAAIDNFGKKQGGKQNDWYPHYAEQLDPLVHAKRSALQKHKDSPTAQSQQALQAARADVQKSVRACVNEYWLNLCSSIQSASDTGNIKAMYDGIKKATGPSIKKSAPLKATSGETITDKTKQMER